MATWTWKHDTNVQIMTSLDNNVHFMKIQNSLFERKIYRHMALNFTVTEHSWRLFLMTVF